MDRRTRPPHAGTVVERVARRGRLGTTTGGSVHTGEADSDSILSSVLDATNSGILFVGRDGVVAYCNRRLGEFFGLTCDRVAGNALDDALQIMAGQVQDRDAFLAAAERFSSDMTVEDVDEITVLRPSRRILERQTAPVYNRAGELLGRIEVYDDVTTQRDLQRNKDEFLSLVSHELRTPVTSIKGYAQLLHRQGARADAAPHLLQAYATIERQAGRMQDLIDVMLDLSRLETGRLRLRLADVDLGGLVRRIADLVQGSTETHQIEVRLPAGPLTVRGDVHRLEQVVTNVLSNAVRYSPAGGAIAISVRRTADWVWIDVADSGAGIAAEDQEHIFERFYRSSGAPESTGLGIGLYISRGIVERHGGRIDVRSKVGEGSTFSIGLPVGPGKGGDDAAAG